jgi:hypothetical protein
MQSSSDANGEEQSGAFRRNKRRTLQDMYRPPLDLLFRGTLEAVRIIFVLFFLLENETLICHN